MMGRRTWLAILAVLCLLAAFAWTSPTLAQGDPVRLDLADSYVVVLNDGRLDVRYTLTFTELESGRDRIRQIGTFPQPHTIVSASGEGPSGAFRVTLSGGPQYYEARFGQSTKRGEQYKVTIRYTVDRSVFAATTFQGQPYRAIAWAPRALLAGT